MKLKKMMTGLCITLMCVSLFGTFFTSAITVDKQSQYQIEDIRNLQDFLLGKEIPDLKGKDYDLDGDGVWNVFDLCLMKRNYSKNLLGTIDEVPSDYTKTAEQQGKVVKLDYTTTDYRSGSDIEKYTYVYVPYDYDESKQYDILYLLHGGGGNAERYFGGENQNSEFKNILDNMIQNNELDSMLVVTPTYYQIGNTDSSVSTAADATENFHEELMNDLVPAVESTFSTYAESTDLSGLHASREHRGFGGFSMGSVATWYTFIHCLDYFYYYLPMSGDCWAISQQGGASASSETAEYLNNVLNKSGYQSDDFFIYGLTGSADIAYNPMNRQISAMQNLSNSKFVYSNDMTRGNYYFSVLEGGRHDYSYIRRYLYNAMPKLFKKYSNKIEPAIDLNGGYDYSVEELHTKNGNDDMYGVLYRPVGASGERPTIIYSHGFGGTYNSGSQYAQTFAKQGYLVYCFDFRGGSNASKSDGSTLEMSIFTEQSDLECVIEKIRSLDESDDDNIFLLGASQGGAVSAITASECVDDIAGMVLLYPAFVLADDARERFQNVDEIPDTYYHMWLTVGKVYFESILEYDFYEHIGKYNKDVLLIHGSEDSIVPISYSERAKDTYSCSELKVIDGAGHGFSGNSAKEAIDFMSDYFYEHLH